MENFHEGKVIRLRIENGILFGQYMVETVDLKTAILATDERLRFTKGIEYPTLADYSKVKVTTKEARDYFTQQSASSDLKAIAVLISSPVGSIIGNFFSKINKPPYPFKIFSDAEKAKEWLKNYV